MLASSKPVNRRRQSVTTRRTARNSGITVPLRYSRAVIFSNQTDIFLMLTSELKQSSYQSKRLPPCKYAGTTAAGTLHPAS